MEKKRNLCAMVPASIFNRFGAERDKAGLTNSEYATKILEEYFSVNDNGENVMAKNNGETRTLAFQIPAALFRRIKRPYSQCDDICYDKWYTKDLRKNK